MFASRLRTALIVASASIGLTGCVGAYGPMGGVSVGYGNNGGYYDPYYNGNGYGGYGYGGYGRSPYGYRYPGSYYGWYDNYYYPGTGYYVYDPYGSRHRWSDAQRRYWEQRRAESIRNKAKIVQTWVDYRRGTSGSDTGVNRVRRTQTVTQPATVTRSRAAIREDRRIAREERREQRRESRRERRDRD